MSIKEKIKSHFSDEIKVSKERINIVRIFFMFGAFAFFLNLFLVWANFYYNLFIQFIPYTYIMFLLLLYVYICLFIKYIYSDKIYNILYFFICFMLFIVFIVILFPFIIKWGIISFINF